MVVHTVFMVVYTVSMVVNTVSMVVNTVSMVVKTVYMVVYTVCMGHTVHLESIQTPWLFPHFVTLQPYTKIVKIKIYLYMIPNNNKAKQVFRHLKNPEITYLHKYSDPLLWDSKLSSGGSCSIDHPWDVSTISLESNCGKLNWLDMIWKDTHLSV